jgi:hypothetical protein
VSGVVLDFSKANAFIDQYLMTEANFFSKRSSVLPIGASSIRWVRVHDHIGLAWRGNRVSRIGRFTSAAPTAKTMSIYQTQS